MWYNRDMKKRGPKLQPVSIRNMSEVERSYIGAMVDGEGCIGVYGGCPTIIVANTDIEIISAMFRAVGGGRCSSQQCSTIGKYHGNKIMFRWRLNTQNDIRYLCEQIALYSIKAQKYLASVI